MCEACEGIFLFCPDHELQPMYEWDPQLNADMNRMMAQVMLDLSDSDMNCPHCGGELELTSDFGLVEPIGLATSHKVACEECGDVLTERVVWEPFTVKFHQDKLIRWKKLLGELASQLHVVIDERGVVLINPEWEAYLGEELARDLRIVVQAAKEVLYSNEILE